MRFSWWSFGGVFGEIYGDFMMFYEDFIVISWDSMVGGVLW